MADKMQGEVQSSEVGKKKSKSLKIMIYKCIMLAIPFVILLGTYVYNDPFMVLRSYNDYDHSYVFLNENVVGYNKYMKYRQKAHYDSFILGNSCTMAFCSADWSKYVHGSCFRFFGNAEGLADVYKKVVFLDKQNQPIRNVLLVVDKSLLQQANMQTKFIRLQPPAISNIANIKFQVAFLQGFLDPDFFIPYIDYFLFRTYREYMKGVINPNGAAHTRLTNDAINPNERRIEKEGEKYWNTFKIGKRHFYDQERVYNTVLRNVHEVLLVKIKNICIKHHTNLKIVISPNISHKAINPKDINMLRRIFGPNVVYDFSGVNMISLDKHNFYDSCHYRPIAGRKMLKIIYDGGLK